MEIETIIEQEMPKTFTAEEVETIKSELNDKYLRLLAEFENFKKRTQKEKEEIKNSTKAQMLSSVLDLDSDLAIAQKNTQDEGIKLILSKIDKFLQSQGIEAIQTETYDADLHEVISIIDVKSNKSESTIVDVVSKGYMLNGKPFRYPKIILGK